MTNNSCAMGLGTFRKVALSYYKDVLLNLQNVRVKMDSQHRKFRSEKELPSHMAIDLQSVKLHAQGWISSVFQEADEQYGSLTAICDTLVGDCGVKDLLRSITEVSDVAVRTVKEWGVQKADFTGIVPTDNGHAPLIDVTLDEDNNRAYLHWDNSFHTRDFLTAVSRLAQNLRDARRQPTTNEYLAFQLAYYKLSHGEHLTRDDARCLGTPGFRPYTQTYMSLTDPGDGHVLGTTRFNEWMAGAIVHVEHLERPRNLPRENIESYRIPSIVDFAKVRLHVGSAAPTTYFFGRKVKDSGNFDEDFLRLVHITAATATVAFFHGAAECKLAMEGLSTSQAVRFMQALRGNVQRSRHQFLSAAWNLNQTILDDYDRDEPIKLTQRMEIATRAIEVVALGGFDKITWDGASDTYPSKCIMYQLSFEEALTIVHDAHCYGLVTYFSAGFKFHEIKHAVYAGVDGIGIGGAQVLRFMDSETGMHGPYTEENIPRILASRDEAAASVRGRGVSLLCRLDTMFFEGSINKQHDDLRQKLFGALLVIDEKEISAILEQLDNVVNIPRESNSPLMAVAKRLMAADEPFLKQICESEAEWEKFTKHLKVNVLAKDTESLSEEYDSDPWLSLRRKYRTGQPKGGNQIMRQVSFDFMCKSSRYVEQSQHRVSTQF